MRRPRKDRGKIPKGSRKSWYLDLAFNLGKKAHGVSQKVGTAVSFAEKNVGAAKASFVKGLKGKTLAGKRRVKSLKDPSEEFLSPIQKEIRDIAAISGLTAAVREMNEINSRHSGHPVIQRLLLKAQSLSTEEQETLSGKFIERLRSNPVFDQATGAFPVQPQMTEEDARKMADAFIECFYQFAGDIGLPPEDQRSLREISDEVTRPLNDLVQFYVKPRTFSQKMSRLWKMQRLFVKAIKLIHLTQRASYDLRSAQDSGRTISYA